MARKETVQQRYPDQFDRALSIPDYSKGKNKYLMWIAKQLKAGHNESDISVTLRFFHENINRFIEKDIHEYKDLKELEDIVKNMGASKRQERQKKKEASEKIFEDEYSLVVRVDDKDAMVMYGSETKWCTTMVNQTYYEDYVCRGNDFYIIIRKDKKALKSAKYAVVRKGLLDFEVFDDHDAYARKFSDKECNILYTPVQAIVADRPPKNMLWLVCHKKIDAQEAAEWLNTQSTTTQNFVGEKIPELRFLNKSPEQLIAYITKSSFGSQQRMIEVFSGIQDKELLKSIAQEFVKEKYNNSLFYPLKLHMCKDFSSNIAAIFKDDKDARIRAVVAHNSSPEDAIQFLTDRSTAVIENAAKKIPISKLLDFIDTSKSNLKKDIVKKVLLSRISEKEVMRVIMSLPRESIINIAS